MSLSQVYFSFSGRIGRQTFWLKGVLLLTVVAVVLGAALVLIAVAIESAGLVTVLIIVLYVAFTWASLAVSIKRWHDRNKSAWWVLISLIPFIGGIWALIETGFLRGTDGPNRYGDETF